jgi:hypothetical protein
MYCLNCDGRNETDARHCVWCGSMLAAPATIRLSGRPIPQVDTSAIVARLQPAMTRGVLNAPAELHAMWRSDSGLAHVYERASHDGAPPSMGHSSTPTAHQMPSRSFDAAFWDFMADNAYTRSRERVQNSWLVKTEAGTILIGVLLMLVFVLVVVPLLLA